MIFVLERNTPPETNTMPVQALEPIIPTTQAQSLIDATTALAIAKTAFGPTAKVREIPKTTDPSTQYRVAYVADGQTTPTVVGYGASWAEALQKSFVSDRGRERIALHVPNAGELYYTVSGDGTLLESVQVVPYDGSRANHDYIKFDYAMDSPDWVHSHSNLADTRTYSREPVITIPNLITPETKKMAAATMPAVSAAPVVSVKAPPVKIAVPRAYVNPANIKTGLMGWDDDVTPAMVLAAITGEHLLVVGPPGTGKSLYARRMFAHFEGKLFETQLSKYSDETALFGAPNLRKLREEGVFEYPKHGLAAAEWGFLDEVFDASDVLLRTMLSLLQEKKFLKGGHEESIPLNSVLATANYTRVNEITNAVVDRFAFSVAAPVLTTAQRAKLYGTEAFEDIPKIANVIGIEQLKAMRAKAKEVDIPASIVNALVSWTGEMGFTPRRERKLASIIRASASMAGRRKADEHDIMAARFCVPLSNSGKVEDAAKSLQPLKDAIMQSLHEGEQLAALGKLSQLIPFPNATNPQDLIACIRATKHRLAELRGFRSVSEKVNKAREQAITVHDQNIAACTSALNI
jgi:MoxR-like ATPase